MLLAMLWMLSFVPDATVHGTVRAAESREPVANATVQVEGLGRAVLTDQHGYFVLPSLPEGRWRVEVRALGFRPHALDVRVQRAGTIRLDFELEPAPLEIAPLAVTARRTRTDAADSTWVPGATVGPGQVHLSAGAMDRVPALAEADVFRALQTLPSVSAASDYSSALYVRGGAPDQNLILLDGAPLFNPFHLGGIFAAIDPDAVASVEMRPGALPARVGDRLSSSVEIWTRDGARDRVRGHGAVGMLSSRLGVEGPLPGQDGSYLVSVRRTYLDLLSKAAYRLGALPASLPYSFTDAHLKLTHDVGDVGRVSASAYWNAEEVDAPEGQTGFPRNSHWDWGSRMVSLQYRQPFGGNWLGGVRFALSRFDASLQSDSRPPELLHLPPQLDATSHMQDALLGLALNRAGRAHHLRLGLQFDRLSFRHETQVSWDVLEPFIPELSHSQGLNTVAAYGEDEWEVNERLQLRGGLRVLHAGDAGTEWMPRVGATVRLRPRLSLVAGGGRYAQAVHTLRNEEAFFASMFAYDVLLGATSRTGLSTGSDAVVGLEWATPRTEVRVEAFRKWMSDLVLAPLPPEPLEAAVLVEDTLLRGSGDASGIEVLASHAGPRGEVTLSYALSFVTRRADNVEYTPRFNRRHILDLTGAMPWGERGQLSARAVMGTGQPYTPGLGLHHAFGIDPRTGALVPGGVTTILGPHNSERGPGYFRVDVAARRPFDRRWFGREIRITPYAQVLNVLNTRNVLWTIPERQPGPVLDYAPQLPILPTFGVEWQF